MMTEKAEEHKELNRLCLEVADLLKQAGYDVPAFSIDSPVWPRNFWYRLEMVRTFAETLRAHLESGKSRGHKDLLWRFFARMRLSPASDILDRIEDEDCIEVYDMSGVQIFRNLNYFSVVSFSVEDMVSINWRREYKRSSKVTLQLVDLMLRFVTGRFASTYDCAKIPVHTVQEMIAKRYLIDLRFKFISPLKQNGKCMALLVATRAKRLQPAGLS